jgi:hypothetical protein
VSCLAIEDQISDDAMLTTTQAAKLVGRRDNTLRVAIYAGTLRAERQQDHTWLLRAGDVRAWSAGARRYRFQPKFPVPRTDEVASLLEEYGSATSEEIAKFLQVHPGNARKYLALLGLEGRAERRPDGQWVLCERRQDNEEGAA